MGLAGIPFSIILRYIESGIVNQGSFAIGFSIGLLAGIFEFIIFKDKLRRLPFIAHLVIKSISLTIVLYVGLSLLMILDVIFGDWSIELYFKNVLSPTMLGLIGYSLIIGTIIIFTVQVDQLLGPGILKKFILGYYHMPKKENRIFMFLDLKDSTRIADKILPEKYYEFLNNYFSDMSDPIIETSAEIYQYVGDEVVLSWSIEKGIQNENCIRIFFLIKERLNSKRDYYNKKYGIVPQFKAGIHSGLVISAQIGELKREVVYNGDILNTAARIQSICNKYNKELLISEELAKKMNLMQIYEVENLGNIKLKGKMHTIPICAISR